MLSWGKQTWGSTTTGWGGEYYLDVASVMGLTGVKFLHISWLAVLQQYLMLH